MNVIIAGASGLIGGHLLEGLLADAKFEKVTSLVRRAGSRAAAKLDAKLIEQIVDFGSLDGVSLPSAQVAFCCLGTTIKKAGSKDAFRAVDHDAVLGFARAAKRAGVSKFIVVTALGADAKSPVFYNRVKGEIERDLTGVGFDSLVVFRPSLLLGERAESRAAEKIAIKLAPIWSPLLIGPLATYRPIEAERVASAMLVKATRQTEPFEVVAGSDILSV